VLAIQAAEIFGAEVTIHFDERGLAFFALGVAKTENAPACIICTSGTAVANLLPAVIEAHYAEVPLLVLSADRPPEMLNTGSNQTIHQPGIFGVYPQWCCDIPCATDTIAIETVRSWAREAVVRTTDPGGGPVHINWMFREPFFSTVHTDEVITTTSRPVVQQVATSSASADLSELHRVIESTKRGICLVGELRSYEEVVATAELITALRWTTFADSLSQLRQCTNVPCLINYADLSLLKEIPEDISPDTVLHLGGRITSKRLGSLLASVPERTVISLSDRLRPFNPYGGISLSFYGALTTSAKELLATLQTHPADALSAFMKNRDVTVATALQELLAQGSEASITEPSLLATLSSAVPTSHLLFLGNSMPIRDFEMFAQPRSTPPWILANRGASGIDGVFSTALGATCGAAHAGTLVVGDLSFLHDLNALALARERQAPFVVVVINNDGGGIFSLLPVSGTSSFERCFGTPHGITFEAIVKGFALPYANPHTIGDFQEAYATALAHNGTTVIEVRTSREENATLHRDIHKAIALALT
jgi:2-succinyl-5-enolpyruvyl-6-hydroxy-3-cyclohexene-1-carboxylate synthase